MPGIQNSLFDDGGKIDKEYLSKYNMKRQKLEKNSVYCIRQNGKILGYCLIIEITPEALNSIYCAVWYSDFEISSLDQLKTRKYLGNFFLTPDLIKNGNWIKMLEEINFEYKKEDFEFAKNKHFVGTKIVGSGIIIKLLEACFGYFPWDGMADKDYFTKIVRKDFEKPLQIKYKE